MVDKIRVPLERTTSYVVHDVRLGINMVLLWLNIQLAMIGTGPTSIEVDKSRCFAPQLTIVRTSPHVHRLLDAGYNRTSCQEYKQHMRVHEMANGRPSEGKCFVTYTSVYNPKRDWDDHIRS